jgi:putative NIF3 family GTP cyclohydrolase 1 type 2
VHHGWFWRGEDPRVVATKRERLATLLSHGISLYAYHLPLDVHPELGNNVQLARRLGWQDGEAFGRDGLLRIAELPAPIGAEALGERLRGALRAPRLEQREWSDAAHSIKGASLGIGALKLAAACERAERAGRSAEVPSPALAAVLLGDVKDALGETLEEAARAAYDLTSAGRRSAS